MTAKEKILRKEVEAALDQVINRKIFRKLQREKLLQAIYSIEGGRVDFSLNAKQAEILRKLSSVYRAFKVNGYKRKKEGVLLDKIPNFSHYSYVKSDQVPVGMFDFSQVEQY